MQILVIEGVVRCINNYFSFRVPLAIVNKAHQANQIYPFAISLIESVRTYERTLEKVRKWFLFLDYLAFSFTRLQHPNTDLVQFNQLVY